MLNKKKIIFWGSPEVAKNILEKLYNLFEISAIVTQPDKPSGRKKILTPTCVKIFGNEKNIPIYTPQTFSKGLLQNLKKYNSDFSIVIAYGKIIPKEFLSIAKNGSINIHYSILPELRGPAPISYALLLGKKETGVSIIQMDEKMDAGNILKQTKIKITMDDDYFSLEKKLTDLAIIDIIDIINNYSVYYNKRVKQLQKYSSYTPLICKEDGRINWYDTNINIFNKIRAFTEWPQTFTFLNEKRIKIIKASLSNINSGKKPGTVFRINKEGIFVACGTGSLIIKSLKPQGKNQQTGFNFFCGNNIKENVSFNIGIPCEYNFPELDEKVIKNYNTVTIHHANSYNFHKDQNEIFHNIVKYHKEKRKWDDIGYHFLIGKNGEIFQGRDPKVMGAHVKAHNENNLGIALIGDFNLCFPSAKQIGGLLLLINEIKKIKDVKIMTHRDFLEKKVGECPGDLLYKIAGYLND